MEESFSEKRHKREFVPLEEFPDQALNPEEQLMRSQEPGEEAEAEEKDPVPFEIRLKQAFEKNPMPDTAAQEAAILAEDVRDKDAIAEDVEKRFDKLVDIEANREYKDVRNEDSSRRKNEGYKPPRDKGAETIRKEAA